MGFMVWTIVDLGKSYPHFILSGLEKCMGLSRYPVALISTLSGCLRFYRIMSSSLGWD